MSVAFSRALRTASSERFLLHQSDGQEVGAVDLHYPADGTVVGTVILLDDKLTDEATVRNILNSIDDILLPGVSMEENNLTFTVVAGKVLGTFVPDEK